MWPGFGSDGQNRPYDGEIDVVEDDGTDNPSYHYRCDGGVYVRSVKVPGATDGGIHMRQAGTHHASSGSMTAGR